jgi:hypothetical protein
MAGSICKCEKEYTYDLRYRLFSSGYNHRSKYGYNYANVILPASHINGGAVSQINMVNLNTNTPDSCKDAQFTDGNSFVLEYISDTNFNLKFKQRCYAKASSAAVGVPQMQFAFTYHVQYIDSAAVFVDHFVHTVFIFTEAIDVGVRSQWELASNLKQYNPYFEKMEFNKEQLVLLDNTSDLKNFISVSDVVTSTGHIDSTIAKTYTAGKVTFPLNINHNTDSLKA